MIKFEFTYVEIINLTTIIIEARLITDDDIYHLSFFSYYLDFTLVDLIDTTTTFIYNNTGIKINVDINGNALVSLDDIATLEESYNIYLEEHIQKGIENE